MEETKPKKKSLAFKDNQITQVKGQVISRDPCTELQAKIITYIASQVKDGDTQETPYTLKIDRFFNMMNEEKEHIAGSYYKKIQKSLKELRKLGLELELQTDTGETYCKGFSFFSEYNHFYQQGTIELFLHKEVIKLYSNFKSEFTAINVVEMMSLKGKYSIPLYEFLLSWRGLTKTKCTTEKLRQVLAIPPKKYQMTYNFFNRCVHPTLEEINDKTELNVEMIPTKSYRNEIQEIEFKLSLKTKKPRQVSETEQLLLDNGITPAVAKNLILNNSEKKIKGNYEYIKTNIAQGKMKKPDNIAGLIHTAIKEDWAHIESEDLFTSQLEKEIEAEKQSKAQKQKDFLAKQKRFLEEEEQKKEPHQIKDEFFKKKLREIENKKMI